MLPTSSWNVSRSNRCHTRPYGCCLYSASSIRRSIVSAVMVMPVPANWTRDTSSVVWLFSRSFISPPVRITAPLEGGGPAVAQVVVEGGHLAVEVGLVPIQHEQTALYQQPL